MEVENDEFLRLVRGRFPFEVSNGLDARLSKYRMSPKNLGGFRGTIRGYKHFDLHRSGNAHFLG